jgi:hypothetical protein
MKLVDGTIILEGEISLNIMDPIYKQIDAYSNTVKINEG